jgi:hypothetical protein
LSRRTRMPSQKDLEELASRLTTLAEVPREDSGHFHNGVYEMVEDLWKQDGGERWAPGTALLIAQSAAQTLNEAVGSLNADDQRRLSGLLYYKPLFDLRENQWVELTCIVNTLAHLFAASVNKSGPSSIPGTDHLRRKAGRRKQTSNNPAFQALIEHLRMLAKWTGGQLRFDKNYPENSNLLTALEFLRPHLPNGIVPDRVRFSTIQSIIAKQNKVWKSSESL